MISLIKIGTKLRSVKSIAKFFEKNSLQTYSKPTIHVSDSVKRIVYTPITSIVVNNKISQNKNISYPQNLKLSDEIDSTTSTDDDVNKPTAVDSSFTLSKVEDDFILNENEQNGNFISKLEMGTIDGEKIEKPINVKLYLDQFLNNKENNNEKFNNGHLNSNYNYMDSFINMKKTGNDISIMNKNAIIENGIKISKVKIFL